MGERDEKLATVRRALAEGDYGAVRLRGVDWFAWLTGGASNVVLLTAETGVAELLVSADGAWVLTNVIEAPRLEAEEPLAGFAIRAAPWQDPRPTEAFLREVAGGRPVATDVPRGGEVPLPPSLVRAKRRLLTEEIERYRILGRDAAAAMAETLAAARPEWTEWDLAGRGAEALWRRGIHPALTLVAGDRRIERFRHPVATGARLGDRAMLVFCARRSGLFANVTRFVYFRRPSGEETARLEKVLRVEAAAWRASVPGERLNEIYATIAGAYADLGVADEIARHHQGGTTGYLSREVVATPFTAVALDPATAVAWNPSLPGAKTEDTALVTDGELEVLTVHSPWPVVSVEGRDRPGYLVRP